MPSRNMVPGDPEKKEDDDYANREVRSSFPFRRLDKLGNKQGQTHRPRKVAGG
jgi:hypothetical protein